MNRTSLLPFAAFTLSLGLVWNLQAQEVAPSAPAVETAPEVPVARADAFTPVTAALIASDLNEARALLQKMKADGLKPEQLSRWENLAARTAVRLGDGKWLAELNQNSNNGTAADELLTISALRLVLSNRLDEAKNLLDSIQDPDEMSEIPRRRYDELQLKIAQLQGDAARERKWAGKLVEFVSSWDSPTCQSCHANPKASGKDVTSLDLNNWWVGARYVELLKESKTADKTVAEARQALEADSRDDAARIKLAYALRATGDDAGAQAKLREIPWTAWKDRPFKKPLRFGMFP